MHDLLKLQFLMRIPFQGSAVAIFHRSRRHKKMLSIEARQKRDFGSLGSLELLEVFYLILKY